ncbi:MAG: hypothetical protein ABR527_02110 [Gemmatimonadota bacterium]
MLGLHSAAPERLLEPERLHLLEPFANQLALARKNGALRCFDVIADGAGASRIIGSA